MHAQAERLYTDPEPSYRAWVGALLRETVAQIEAAKKG
jgi:hypothetical protein